MTKLERTLLAATLAAVGAGVGVFFALQAQDRPKAPADSAPSAVPAPPAPRGAPGAVVGPDVPDPDAPDDSALAARPGAGVVPGLRVPSGADFSDPVMVQNLIRQQLALENPRWDHVADWIGRVEGPIDADIKNALMNALQFGNAAGAIQALERVRDGTVVPDLLRILDDPRLDAHDRGNVLVAIAGVPGADLREAVTGIESRMSGDFAHDGPYLQAIARLGGVEAARALVDAVNASADPTRFGPEVWRSFDLKRSPEASEHLARVLADAPRSEAALVALVDLAGRPGATPALVTSLLALDAAEQREPVRRAALTSLGKTGDDAALARLVELAEKGADYASVAARAIGTTATLSEPARARLLDVAKATTNDYLRQNAVEALGATRTKAAVPLLTDLVQNGSDLVRKESARALGRIGADAAPAVSALALAYGGGDESLRQQAVLALAQIGTEDARRVLEQARTSEASPVVKKTLEAAWRGLQARTAREGEVTRRPARARALVADVVLGALAVLAVTAPARAGETPARTLEKALKADEAARRVAAVAEAGRVGGAAPVDERRRLTLVLRKVLEGDPDGDVRLAAVASLARLGDEAAWVPVLVAAVTAKDERVRAAAVTAVLTGRGDVVAVARKLLREDQDPTFRAEVALLLGRRRRVDAVPALLEGLADKHPRVVTASAEALEAVSGQALGYDARPWADWWATARLPAAAPAPPGETVTREAGPPEVPPAPPPARGLVPDLYGLPLRAKDYVFVVDVSGSIGAEGLETAKGELVRAVERLPSDVRISALFFDEEMRAWHPEMVLATPAHKAELARFVRGIPRGKRTDVMTPLNAGLAIVARRVAARAAAKDPAPEPVTMVVVSDGQENVRGTPGDAVGDKLERLDLAHAVVHALVLGGKDNALMAALARRAGGVYRVVP